MKKWSSDDGHDLKQKNRLSKIIRHNHLRHYPLLDQTIFINNQDFRWTIKHPEGYKSKEELLRDWSPFIPDMLFPISKTIIEFDGSFHTDTEKGARRTKLRNQYYEYAGIKLIVYSTEEFNKMTDDEVLKDLKKKL